MLPIVGRRLLQLVIVLLLLSVFTFVLMKLAPGDPVNTILRIDEFVVTEADGHQLRKELGLDQPILIQYGQWIYRVAQLDLGHSLVKNKPVLSELLYRLPATLQLTAGALVVMLIIAVPLGIIAAKHQGGWPDQLSRGLALFGASIPSFWFGLLLIYLFAFRLQLLPSTGKGSLLHMILPSITLGFSLAATYARLFRSGLLESLNQDYIRAARARGIAEWRIMTIHAARAALLPVITVFGMSIGSMLGGAVVVEVLFSWPGLGSMVMEAILARDYPLIQGFVLLTGTVVVITNLLVDLSYRIIDPRIRLAREAAR